MKVRYIYILLFALPLNILVALYNVNDQRNHNSTTPRHIRSTRLLCECELYAPSNYDNDSEMKRVMENFYKETQQRFHEYDERMKTTRQKCKDQCDKEMQKIILKDKLEKQMAEQLTKLDTNITTEDIPTCVCEKSIADKMEKFCLNCGKTMGGVAPGWGLISGLWYAGWLNAAMAAAEKAGLHAGITAAIDALKGFSGLSRIFPILQIEKFVTATNYSKKMSFVTFINEVKNTKCVSKASETEPFCNFVSYNGEEQLAQRAAQIADDAVDMAEFTKKEVLDAAAPALTTYSNAIVASVVAIVVIVLIMVIIYLILRYRRKKKMKKKLQYIKLLEE